MGNLPRGVTPPAVSRFSGGTAYTPTGLTSTDDSHRKQSRPRPRADAPTTPAPPRSGSVLEALQAAMSMVPDVMVAWMKNYHQRRCNTRPGHLGRWGSGFLPDAFVQRWATEQDGSAPQPGGRQSWRTHHVSPKTARDAAERETGRHNSFASFDCLAATVPKRTRRACFS